MIAIYRLTPELRRKLKSPLGTLVRGSFIETMSRFKGMLEKEKPPRVISVGDTVSRNLVKNNVYPQLLIIDNKCMRKRTEEPDRLKAEKIVYIKNPQGTIAEEAVAAIQDALKSNVSVKMIVEGEEDLLTLVAISYAPENSLVVYGQPYEGIVVVKITPEKKAEIAEILRAMEYSKS